MHSKYCYTTQPSCDLLCGFNMLMKQVNEQMKIDELLTLA